MLYTIISANSFSLGASIWKMKTPSFSENCTLCNIFWSMTSNFLFSKEIDSAKFWAKLSSYIFLISSTESLLSSMMTLMTTWCSFCWLYSIAMVTSWPGPITCRITKKVFSLIWSFSKCSFKMIFSFSGSIVLSNNAFLMATSGEIWFPVIFPDSCVRVFWIFAELSVIL